MIEPQPDPWLYSTDGSYRELLAGDLKREWTCRLTAFLKPVPSMFNLRVSELRQEADAFMWAGRRSLGHTLLGMFRGKRDEDPIVGRFQAVAPQLRRAAGKGWSAAAPHAFMESEGRAQRELLLSTLHRVQVAWSDWGGTAITAAVSDAGP